MILSSREGPVAVLSLDRPEMRNALTPPMFAALLARIDEAAADSAVRAIVLTGEGKVFCGGFDLKLCLAAPGTLESLLRSLHATIERLLALDRPVVIAGHGAALAGACALLGSADVVVSDAEAKLGYPVTPLGISPAVSAPYLAQTLSPGAARSRLLDPDLISGRQALRLGLIHECLATPAEVRPRALEIARALAAQPPGALAATRRWLARLSAIDSPPAHRAAALEASLGIAGGPEERQRLAERFA